MTIALVGWGAAAAASGAATVTAARVAGAATDTIVLFHGGKPYTYSPAPSTPADWTQRCTGTSGSVASGVSVGSVRTQGWTRNTSPTASGSDTVVNTSSSPGMVRTARCSTSVGSWDSLIGVVLSDTDETGTGVSATGTVASGAIASGDVLLVAVTIKDDAPNHTSQSLTVAGCTLGTISWQTKFTSTHGNDGAMYHGYVEVTAGSATGTLTYAATSSVSGASSTAVSVIRLREGTPVDHPLTGTTAITSATTGAITGSGAAQEPTLVTTGLVQPWSNTTDPAVSAGIPVLADDRILVIGVSADSQVASDLTLSGNNSAPVYVDSGHDGGHDAAPSSTRILTLPGDTAADDLFVVVFAHQSTAAVAITPPGVGTTTQALAPAGQGSNAIAYSVHLWKAPSSPPASITWGLDASVEGSLSWARYRGVDPTTPLDAAGSSAFSLATSWTAPSITTTVPNAFVLGGANIVSGSRIFTQPSGWTTRVEAPDRLGYVATKGVQSAAGATGTQAFAQDGASLAGHAWQIALRPEVVTWAEPALNEGIDRCGVYVWTTTVPSDQTVTLSIDRASTNGNFSGRYWVIRGSDGFGTPVIDATGPASLALSTTQDESTIIALTADWNAQNSSVTWTAISTATESSPDDNAWTSGQYTVHSHVFAGIDTAGSKTVANNIADTENTLVAIEVKGTTASGPVEHPLTGTTAVVSTNAGAPTAEHPLSGTTAATSSTTGAPERTPVDNPLTGTLAVVSGAAGNIALQAAVSGATTVTSATAGTPTAVHPVAGVTAVVSAAAGAVSAQLVLSGVTPVTSATTGAPTALHPLSGVTAVTSATNGDITSTSGATDHPLTGTTAIVSAALGAPTAAHPLSGVTAAVSTNVGAPTAAHPLSGVTAAVSANAGAPTAKHPLSGVTAAVSANAGAPTAKHPLSGVTAAISATIGAPTAQHPLAGAAAVTTATAGAPTAQHPLAGATAVVSTTTGDITANNFGVTHELSGTTALTSAATGAIDRSAGLSGTTAITSTAAGTLRATMILGGTTAITSGTAGALASKLQLSGAVAITSAAFGAPTAKHPLSGVTAAQSGASGVLTFQYQVSGVTTVASGTTGTIERIHESTLVAEAVAAEYMAHLQRLRRGPMRLSPSRKLHASKPLSEIDLYGRP